MATIQHFDELNNFFSEMELPEEDKRWREELAEDILDMFLFVFAYIDGLIDAGKTPTSDELITMIATRFEDVLDEKIPNMIAKYPDLDGYPKKLAQEIVDVTMSHLLPMETTEDGNINYAFDADYWTSEDRASVIGKNEANTVGNAIAQQDAVDAGYTYKTWVTMKDERVRMTHIEVDEETVPIESYFKVGGDFMMYPRDPNGSASETVNCRCTVQYS